MWQEGVTAIQGKLPVKETLRGQGIMGVAEVNGWGQSMQKIDSMFLADSGIGRDAP